MSGELSAMVVGIPEGAAGRIQPSFVPPEGDHVLCLGYETDGRRLQIAHGDFISVRQNGDFDVTTIFRFRVRVRGPQFLPVLVTVGAVATQTYTVTINGVDHDYVADSTGLAIAGQTGAVASVTAFDGTLATIAGLTGMTAASVGRQLVITGAASGGNNGTFPIDELVSDTSVKVRNTGAVSGDANNGSISWTEQRRPDNDTTIALGLRDAINAGIQPVTASVVSPDGLLQVETSNEVLTFTTAVGTNLTVATFKWLARLILDGSTYWEEEIEADRLRNPVDAGGMVTNLAGAVNMDFQLCIESSTALGMIETELPAFCVDALVFDEVT